ncbi:hypothetical protein ONS95_001529 [Cadophora gregata]|uniref:uncharacterized protein n=1 Tax=Cadophora gregata TaxID=51156 RepID=UPI0026DC7DD7|nr:uncharacterized protein ONS95_001529 [Cadophora gregata]KAK0111152.1 hypothetical protein ONS95_001529 [Cadophora gregata]KAK0112382.1 hypothetical protein ONS96_001625 [Cadophora gregata f. sp. sojae]
MPFFSPLVSRRFLYASAGLTAFTIYKHTEICINELFPAIDENLGPDSLLAFTAKGNYLNTSATYVTMLILQLKWAKHGLTAKYDKILLVWYLLQSFMFGVAYLRKAFYTPLLAWWGIPALMGMSQL